MRKDIEANSQHIYLIICRIAEKSGISLSMPTVRCQHADHMEKSITIPFLDYHISNSFLRLSSHSKQAASL